MHILHAGLTVLVFTAYLKIYQETKLNIMRSFGWPSPDDYLFCTKFRSSIGVMALDSGTWTLNNSATLNNTVITLEPLFPRSVMSPSITTSS